MTILSTEITIFPVVLSQPKSRNILRVGLHSLGSALWGDDLCCYNNPKNVHALTSFLYGLRALLRTSLSVAVVTVPSHLIQVRRCPQNFVHWWCKGLVAHCLLLVFQILLFTTEEFTVLC